jgi:DNA-directed RNA polymerase specialized sigma24 family protein
MSDPAVSAQAGTREAIVGNDAAAFEDFFRGQTQSLFAHLCLITGNRAEAEELAQDAFLKVWERWDRVADMEEPTGYLYRTAMNLFRKRYRRAVLALRKTVSEELRRDEFATVEDRSIVARALVGLAPRQRAASPPCRTWSATGAATIRGRFPRSDRASRTSLRRSRTWPRSA